jgi:SMI1 / KNR4 family (SUKH-1)
VELPSEYLSFLRQSNGGEGPLGAQPFYLQIDPAEEVALALEQRRHEAFFPGFIMIGSDGGGEYIALDVRGSAPWPVVAIDMTNSDLSESVLPIAPSFVAFSDLIGK